MILDELFTVIQDRKKRKPKDSYVASLFRKGKDRVLQKVGEEAVELVIAAAKSDSAAKNTLKKELVNEMADLFFHLLVLMASLGIKPKDVFLELEKRRNP